MIHRRSWLIYALLLAVGAAFLGWQVAEHIRLRKSARAALIDRAKDISNTVALVMRSQRRFGGVISRERMEGALKDIVRPGELNGIALLNAAGEVVASAGDPPELHTSGRAQQAQLWDRRAVTLVNLVDLGTNLTQELERPSPTIVV